MKIGILGCGYVGQAAALHWKKEGHFLTATTRQPDRVAPLQNLVHEVYLLNGCPLSPFIEKQEVLLICVAPDSSSDYAATYLHTAQEVAANVSSAPSLVQIIYTSSTSVYGDHQGAWVTEETPIKNLDANRKILYEAEQVLLNCTKPNLNICILRLSEIYGPGREIEERLKRLQPQPFAGNGESYTNLIHRDDIVQALHFAMIHRLQGIYNLSSDFHVPRKEFYHQLCQKNGIAPIQWNPSRTSLHGGNRRVSNQKIKEAGFHFKHPHFFEF